MVCGKHATNTFVLIEIVALFLLFLIQPLRAQAKSFNILNPQVVQGDVLIIRIEPQWHAPALSGSAISLFGKHYLPNKYGDVFIGIDKNIAPGKHIATLVEYGRGVRLSWDYEEIEVIEKFFPVRRRIPGKPRNPGEVKAIKKAYEKGNLSEKYIDSDFILPLDRIVIDKDRATGDVFSAFGGENHRGVDLVTLNPKTREHKRPVRATNSGQVVLVAKNFSLEGNMIIIDHGSGIFSIYAHLSKFNVREGQFVKAGEEIGISGKSGRITGPHLHFGIKVGDPFDPLKFTVVDPIEFIKIANQYLK